MKWNVLLAIAKRNLIMLYRYPLNLVAGLITLFMVFLAIFHGARMLSDNPNTPSFGSTLSSIIVGFVLWNFITFAYSDLTWSMVSEAQQGTLEQLYMSPVGFGWVCFSNLFSWLLINLVINFFMLFVIMAVTGKWLSFDLPSALVLMILTVLPVYGVGFIMAGLALVYKQVQAVFQILHFIWLGLIAAPLDKMPFLQYAPISLGSKLLRETMIDHRSLWSVPPEQILLLLVNSFAYLLIGYLIFKKLEKMARVQGVLGHY